MAPTRWQPDRAARALDVPLPPLPTAIGRGLLCRCPACGRTRLFSGYLRVVAECAHCHARLGHARADDAPPYFTIFAVGHIVVPIMFMYDRAADPPIWLLSVIFLPLTVALTLALLRPIKGGTVGLMLKLGMVKSSADD